MTKYALCTPEDIRGITAVTASDYSFDDPMIKNCILIATSLIERYCGRSLVEKETTDQFTVPATFKGRFLMYPSVFPVKEGTVQGKIDGEDISASLQSMPSGWAYNSTGDIYVRHVVMAYTGGFPAKAEAEQTWDGVTILEADGDLIMACAMQASFMANHFLKNNVGEKAVGVKAGAMLIIPEAAVLLAPYVKPKYMGAV